MTSVRNHNALFLSDFHLGSLKCQATRLLRFLESNNAKRIYLIGDIFDGTYAHTWPDSHYQILQTIFNKVAAGSRVIFIPGNHDCHFRSYVGNYGNLWIVSKTFHYANNGRVYVVTHGDETDFFRLHFLLRWINSIEYMTSWHLWEVLRSKLPPIIKRHNNRFEKKMMSLYKHFSGVICGHVHCPNITSTDKFTYLNCGDWTYHCTALAENNGEFELLQG